MTMPLVILAICSVGAGFLGMPHSLGGSNRFEKFLEPVFAKEAVVLEEGGKAAQVAAGEKQVEHTDPLEYTLMFASVGAAVVGWWLAQRAYKNADKGYKEPIHEISPRFYKTLFRKWYVDEIYDWFVHRPREGRAGAPGRDGPGRRAVEVRRQRDRWHGERRRLDHAHERHAVDAVGQVDYRRPAA